MSSDRLLSVAAARERLAVSHSTLYELLRTNKLQSVKIGRARRIPESAVDAFIRARMVEAGHDAA